MTRYPYPIGTVCHGAGFSGRVTATPGPYTVTLDDAYHTPVSLIERAELAASPADDPLAGFEFEDDALGSSGD